MFSFKSIYFVIFYLILNITLAQISDKRLCVDSECKEPISKAVSLIRYSSPDSRILSFLPNSEVIVFSKEAGKDTSLWGVEINGKKGYAPKQYIREVKIYKKPAVLVDTELVKDVPVPQVPSEPIVPNKVQQPYEVIDGTKIYLDYPEDNTIKATTEHAPPHIPLSPTESIENQTEIPSVLKIEENSEDKFPEQNQIKNQEISTKNEEIPGSEESLSNSKETLTQSGETLTLNEEKAANSEETKAESEETLKTNEDTQNVQEQSVVGNVFNTLTLNEEKAANSDETKSESEETLKTNEDTQNVQEESVVGNVFNTLSNWISDDEKSEEDSEEIDDEDEYDDEEDEDDDEEEDLKENVRNETQKEENILETALKEEVPKVTEKEETLPVPVQNKEYVQEVTLNQENVNKEEFPIKVNITEESEPKPFDNIANVNIFNKDIVISPYSANVDSNVLKEDTVETKTEYVLPKTEDLPNTEENVNSAEKSEETVNLSASSIKDKVPLQEENISSKEENVATHEVPKQTESIIIEPILNENTTPMPFSTKKEDSVIEEVKNEEISNNVDQGTQIPDVIEDKPQNIEEVPQKTEKNIQKGEEIQKSDAPEPVIQNIAETIEETNPDVKKIKEYYAEKNRNIDNLRPQETIEDMKKIEEIYAEKNINVDNLMPHAHPNPLFGNLNQALHKEENVNNEPIKKEEIYVPVEQVTQAPELMHAKTEEKVKNVYNYLQDTSSEKYKNEEIEVTTASSGSFVDNVYPNEAIATEIPYIEESEINREKNVAENEESAGFLNGIFSLFGSNDNNEVQTSPEYVPEPIPPNNNEDKEIEEKKVEDIQKNAESSKNEEKIEHNEENFSNYASLFEFNSDVLLYLATTAISVIVFLFGYMMMDKSQRETPLLARINKLEKELLITLKENELLQEQGGQVTQIVETVDNSEELYNLRYEVVELQNNKLAMEEQIQGLEKELENSTEVGMELNRMLSEMLNSSNGDEVLKNKIEQLQKQLLEQQDTVNSVNESLSLKETENYELHLELEITNKKVLDLQTELDKMLDKVVKIEEERDLQQNTLENEIKMYQKKHKEVLDQKEVFNSEVRHLKLKISDAERDSALSRKEYEVLKESFNKIKGNSTDLKSILDVTSIKAELQQLQSDNSMLKQKLEKEETSKNEAQREMELRIEECRVLRENYEKSDKEKVEINTKLDVLNNYFKDKEAQLLKEISKYKAIWAAKEGEATSTTERIKYMQEELQNFKAQNETLKQEIINQEVELKSQISMLEKKVHENWVTARQSERKLEDAKQEAAQLRNRLTLRERAINEEKIQNRLQSPLDINGHPHPEHTMSPPPVIQSPPLLYPHPRDLTTSPPIPGLPPFLPPPPDGHFMPPPLHHSMPYMPPPPGMFPGDHRPPPLGRMSSPPPLGDRYSPESTVYSGYGRDSPSHYDSEYPVSPPPPPQIRGYSPFGERRDDRRDYNSRREYGGPKVNGRKGNRISSESDQSTGSRDNTKNRKPHSRV